MLDGNQLERYKRNILLDGIGNEGQEKLLKSAVLVVGAGGLGSPAAYYLAAAGVGRIGILDSDSVELSNLQRQILHGTPDLGRSKAVSAGEKLSRLNPDLCIDVYNRRLAGDTAGELISRYDIVVDCTDNFQSRYIINECCLRLDRPFVYGGVLAYMGQLMTILPGRGPCFRCLYRGEPEVGAPDCATAGVLGAVPGVIGTLQACEAVKYLTGVGELLEGRLLVYDALTASFTGIDLQRDPSCPACGHKK